MTHNQLAIDIAAAVTIAAVALVVEPGVAIGALLALLMFLVCIASLLFEGRRPSRTLRKRPTRR